MLLFQYSDMVKTYPNPNVLPRSQNVPKLEVITYPFLSVLKNCYYTFPEVSLYKSNTLDWYVIPRDKIKNITYGYANEGAGLTYTGAICVDKASETHLI